MRGYIKIAKRNFTGLFTGDTHEEVINAAGHKVIIINEFRLPENPLPSLRAVSPSEWLYFFCGYCILFVEILNFTSATIEIDKLVQYFGSTKAQVTMAVTYSLLTKFVGAFIFGIAADSMGRKYPMIINCLLLGFCQLATTFTTSIKSYQFSRLSVGVAMGGMYGNAAATALEHCNSGARGFLSGLFESAAGFAFLAANLIALAVGGEVDTWKVSFYVGSGAAFFVAIFRACLPESCRFFKKHYDQSDDNQQECELPKVRISIFVRQIIYMIRHKWPTMLYLLMLVSFVCGVAMNSMDPYVIFLMTDKGMSSSEARKVAIVVSLGGILGPVAVGWCSQTIGRRRAIIFSGIGICALIPWTILPNNHISLAIGGFLMTFFSTGILGVLPIHMNELSEPKFRTLVPGIIFQLAFTIAAPLPQLAIFLAERTESNASDGRVGQNYGPIIGAFVALCGVLTILWSAIGPERRGSQFEMIAPAGIDESKIDPEPMKTVLVFGNRSGNQSDYC
ncbi:hypothetical protein CBS101457_001348 [Exobasidium rhododendri]|nr:hypothetical protein CBS101457_001348 [Exobasidium rhododendri]